MLRHPRVLGTLVSLGDRLPWPAAPTPRSRGHPRMDADRLLVKARVVMSLRRLSPVSTFVAFLDPADPLPQQWRPLLAAQGRLPTRRPWERRLVALPQHVPGCIGGVGRALVRQRQPWATPGRAGAVDSTPRETGGGVWHQKHREQGVVPHTSLETAAGWSTAGWHGWWYGWKRPLAVTVGAVWLPLAAALTVAHRGANAGAPSWVHQLPWEGRSRVGDTHENDPEWRDPCQQRGWAWVAPRRGPHPHRESGVEVRRVFHQLRAQAMEPFNGLCKNVFEWRVKMPVKGLQRSQLLALGAVVLSQLVLLYHHERNLP